MLADTGFYVATAMAIFAILFGTRHIDASEHHEGMVAAIAFESIVKLIAFLAVGLFVTFGIYGGFADLFDHAGAVPAIAKLFTISGEHGYGQWVTLTILSMAAIICLPRQFQVTVVENVDESHLDRAVWLFPLYLLLINIFVLPIAFGGLLQFPDGTVDADTFVLALPMAHRQETLALFAYIGGLSAATGMVIVASVALSTMVCNDLLMPVLLRIPALGLNKRGELHGLLLGIRRGSIIGVLFVSYLYARLIGESYALVTIGLVSFAAAAQFAPAIIGGIFWRGASRTGAFAGLGLGFLVWAYTLLLPSLARSGWLPDGFIEQGLFGIALLKPYELFGLTGMDIVSHSVFWSMLANLGGYVGGSLIGGHSLVERIQATRFVDVFLHEDSRAAIGAWRGRATVVDLRRLVVRFVGKVQADRAFAGYARQHDVNLSKLQEADIELVQFVEQLLAGAIGAASARVMVASVVQGEIVGIEGVMSILDEASQVIEYSHQLEHKSRALEAATQELRAANEKLQELDRLKDDFLSTISHELRTPLTSIRSFSEILAESPDLEDAQRNDFLGIIIKESERLSRLINQILDLAKMEAGRMEWQMADIDPREVIEDALLVTSGLFRDRKVRLEVSLPDDLPPVHADRDRLMQVVVNLLSNAERFCEPEDGCVRVDAERMTDGVCVNVRDNGPGVPPDEQEIIFERFRQARDSHLAGRPTGTGLGLPICRQIVEHFGGRIWIESGGARGATFSFTVPLSRGAAAEAAE